MKTKIEFRDPPEGYELVWDCNAIDGDMYPVKSGWARGDFSGRWFAILARRKKAGLVESFDAIWELVQTDATGWCRPVDKLRDRLAAIEREPTDEECQKWVRYVSDQLTGPWTPTTIRAAIKAAREIGQGGDK